MEEFDFIETPENVELQRRLAGVGSRFLAGLLDILVISLIYVVLFILLLIAQIDIRDADFSSSSGIWLSAVLILVAFLIFWGYFIFFEMWMNGQSPGKKYVKIRVVQVGGGSISFSSIAIRNILRIVDILGFYTVAGIFMFLSKKVQRLGDIAAGTVVISEEIPDYSSRYDKKGRVIDDELVVSATLESTGLKPEEYRILRNYWLRRGELTIEARRQLLPRIIRPILERLGQTLPNDSPEVLEGYVEQVMNQNVSGTESGDNWNGM